MAIGTLRLTPPERSMSTRTRFADLLGALRQPEYTGENRCVPCTLTNLAIAAVVALGLAAVFATPIGLVVFLVCLAVIYLRGYLVPGTPEITSQYFPPWLLSLFGKDAPVENAFDVGSERATTEATPGVTGRHRPAATATTAATVETEPESEGSESETTDGETPEPAASAEGPLFAARVVTRDGSDVVLAPSFREAWRDRIEATRERGVEPAAVGRTFDAEDVRRTGELSFVIDGNASVRWESDAALVADVAAATLLRERLEGWSDFDKDDRTATLTGLRLFLENCPSCDGVLEHDDDRADPCCQKPHLVTTATCGECGSPIADAAVVDSGDSVPVRVRLLRV